MINVLKMLGFLLAFYTFYAAVAGEVHAKSGVRFRIVSRDETPFYFWSVIGIYGAFSIVLFVVP